MLVIGQAGGLSWRAGRPVSAMPGGDHGTLRGGRSCPRVYHQTQKRQLLPERIPRIGISFYVCEEP
jgi:hypothetical protein